MQTLSYVAAFSFVSGLALLTLGVAFRSHGDGAEGIVASGFDLRQSPAALATVTPVGSRPSPLVPTPTTAAFGGAVGRIRAGSIGLDHPVEEIGITNNQLDTPKDAIGSVGWYYIYPKPGYGQNAVFAAHKNFDFHAGPFSKLDQFAPGDRITIAMSGGPTYTYEVIFYQRYPVDSIPMGELITAPQRPPGEEWITLITCGGRFEVTQSNGLGHYLERDVVIAKRTE